MTSELRFPHAIDNSMRKELVKCQKIAHWKHERGLSQEESVDVHAGGAFAAGMEAMRRSFYEQHRSVEDALGDGLQALHVAYGDFKCPDNSNKSAIRMAGALAYYASENRLDVEELTPLLLGDQLGIEIAFNEQIPILHPVDGAMLTYCGRFDMLAIDRSEGVWVVDEKTTKAMGEAWVHQWQLDSGMTGYCWAAQRLINRAGLTYEVKGAIINGIAIRAMSNASPYEHMRVTTYRQPWFIERWYSQMLKDVHSWVEAFKHQDHNQVLDAHAGCAIYNAPCPYANLCNAANPAPLFQSYEVKWWNPLTREDER